MKRGDVVIAELLYSDRAGSVHHGLADQALVAEVHLFPADVVGCQRIVQPVDDVFSAGSGLVLVSQPRSGSTP